MKTACKIISAVLVLSVVATIISIVICRFSIKVTRYQVELDGVTTPVRAVLVTDVHARSFGKDNIRLLEKIEEQKPDVIFADGDFISRDASDEDVEKMLTLLADFQKIAPVYYAPGNHEEGYSKRDEFYGKIQELGIDVLNDTYTDTQICGQSFRIGGTMGHAFKFGRTDEEFENSSEYKFLTEFQKTENPKICLAHMPDTFAFGYDSVLGDIELVLSGHTHGGLVRLPFVGGLYAPMQGYFPVYDKGYFKLGEKMQMIICSGLAGYDYLPRINNLPEICVIDIT